MAPASDKVLYLRQLLAERFKEASLPSQEIYATGLPVLDEIGIPRGALTELIPSVPRSSGGPLLFYAVLHAVLQKGERAVLIDGKNSFAPSGISSTHLNRLLWVRCHRAWEAIKAADLAIRDGNIPLVIILLSTNSPGELRKIPAPSWHRLQLLAEKSAVTVLAFTPQAQVGCARLRISVDGDFPLKKLHLARTNLLPSLHLHVARRRLGQERSTDEAIRRAACA